MNDRRKDRMPATPIHRSATFKLDEVLRGEVLWALSPAIVEPHHVDEMLVNCRPRFAPNAVWTIGVAPVTNVTGAARGRLVSVFDEFRAAGGTLIIIIGARQFVINSFTSAAFNGGNVLIRFVKDSVEAEKLRKEHRKPAPKK